MESNPEIATTNPGRKNDNDPGPFHCKICSKAFTKRPSRNRHVLYCRKKLGDNLPVLRKSCAACRKAKVKCNSDFPRCSHCEDKDLSCVYELTRRSESSTHKSAPQSLNERRSDDAMLAEISTKSRDQNSWDISPSFDIQLIRDTSACQSNPLTVEPDFIYQDTTFEWEPDSGYIEEIGGSDTGVDSWSSNSSRDFSLDWFSLSPLPGQILESTFSTPPDCMFHTPYLVPRPMDQDVTHLFNSLVSPRSPFIESYFSPSSQIGRAFLMQNIQSYTTLLATSTLPPFIHSVSLPTLGPSPPSSSPLEICKSIISMYVNKTPATSSFIWRSILMEKERFMKELGDADDWTGLSMLQAISIYVFLRVCDSDSFSVDFDCGLIRDMTVIAISAEKRQLLCQAEVEGYRPEWTEWILMESKRRTVTLLFILYLLFDIKPEQRAKSHVGLLVLPLPAHKQLWQASGEEEWKREYDELLRAREGRSYLRYEDLIDLGKGKVNGEKMKDLRAWMTSGDAFGMLVMMAATTL